MAADRIRVSKACETCRRRKKKCDGNEPCQNCQPAGTECLYRIKARARPSRASTRVGRGPSVPEPACSPAPTEPLVEESPGDSPLARPGCSTLGLSSAEDPSPQVYDCVAAHHHAPRSTDSSQLYYGPSSNFAFLQQVRRSILSCGAETEAGNRPGLQADEAGLDMFMQRNIFFGVPLRISPMAPPPVVPYSDVLVLVPLELARGFLGNFKGTSLLLYPFLDAMRLDAMLEKTYTHESRTSPQPGRRILLFLCLAIGALGSVQTDLAERLFLEAKRDAVLYEDTVSLFTIQLSLLMADYQSNMGRPNSAYLHMGQACRKGLALGLNIATEARETQERSVTLWCLYFHEMSVAP